MTGLSPQEPLEKVQAQVKMRNNLFHIVSKFINFILFINKTVMKKLTTKDFIKKAKIIHKDVYDYSLVNYKNYNIKIKIMCPIHGEFNQKPDYHLRGSGCPECAIQNHRKDKQKSLNDFIVEAHKIHNNKFDYSKVVYLNNSTKIKIMCPIHGEFQQVPHAHLRGADCTKCSYEKRGNLQRVGKKEFVNRANKTHRGIYNYSKLSYTTLQNKVKIICPIHGEFEQEAHSHLKGSGCKVCNFSKGEREVKWFLEDNRISFISQKTFEGCKDINPLPFDFYLPDYNMCVEFDGRQHRQPIVIFGGVEGLKDRQKKDMIKTKFCRTNSIKLVRINSIKSVSKKLNFLLS